MSFQSQPIRHQRGGVPSTWIRIQDQGQPGHERVCARKSTGQGKGTSRRPVFSPGLLRLLRERVGEKAKRRIKSRKPGLGVGSAGYSGLVSQVHTSAARPWTLSIEEREDPPAETGAVINLQTRSHLACSLFIQNLVISKRLLTIKKMLLAPKRQLFLYQDFFGKKRYSEIRIT